MLAECQTNLQLYKNSFQASVPRNCGRCEKRSICLSSVFFSGVPSSAACGLPDSLDRLLLVSVFCCCCGAAGCGSCGPSALAARCCSCKARRSALVNLGFLGGTTKPAGGPFFSISFFGAAASSVMVKVVISTTVLIRLGRRSFGRLLEATLRTYVVCY